MSDLLEMVSRQLAGGATEAISKKIGANTSQTESAIGNALPILLAAMAKNSKNSSGASSLANALDRDHDGSILNDLAGFVSKSEQGPGAGILSHVLGGKRSIVEGLVTKSSGLDRNATARLMEILAPVVMGALGKQKQSSDLDAAGIASMLGSFMSQNENQHPKNTSLVNKILDTDGDGSIADDLTSMGVNFLSKMMK